MARRIQPPPSPLDAFLGAGVVFTLTGVSVVALFEVSRRASFARDWLLRTGFDGAAGDVGAACAVCGPIIAWIGALALFHRPTRAPVALEALVCLVLTAPFSLVVAALLPDSVLGDREWLVSPLLARLGTPILVGWLAALAWRLGRPATPEPAIGVPARSRPDSAARQESSRWPTGATRS